MSQTVSTNEPLSARLARVSKKQTLLLTHFGRKTGKPYRVRIWFTVDGDQVNLQTMNMKRQWIKNVQARPKVSLQIGGETFEGEVRQVTEQGEMAQVVKLMKRKYPIALPYLWIKKAPDGAFRVTLSKV
ncbi:MAG: nitroreductase family deazaflavin-dependent oxidoreductase [Myxococcales bacterium]